MKPSRNGKRVGTETRDYVRRLESLVEASKILNTTFDLGKLLSLILDLATKNLGAARGTIYLIDDEKKELWSRVLKGKKVVEIRLPVGTGIAGHVAKTGKTVNVQDARQDQRFYAGIDERSGFRTKTMLCMPMNNREGRMIGVFQIMNKRGGEFVKEDRLFLEAFSDHAALAIENARLHQSAVEKERVEKEIQIASGIQQRLLPKTIPTVPHYDLAAEASPCKAIGGDFYDVVPLDGNRYALVMADVSGKGIPAALLVSTLHASLRAYIQTYTDLGKLVQKLNTVVYENTTPERFITCFVAVIDSATHRLTYVNAGHNPPYILHQDADDIPELGPSGLPLGMVGNATYEVRSVDLLPGDVVTLYTDGVTEAMNRSSDLYSEERFQKCAVQARGLTAERIKNELLGDVHKFVAGEPQSDDLTLLIAKRADN